MLAALFVLSFAFDVKGARGGSVWQYAMATVNIAAFLFIGVRMRGVLPRRGIPAAIFWVWCGLLIAGSVSAAVYSVPFGPFIRTILPFILFAEGFLVAWWLGRDEAGATALTGAMTGTAVLSLLFTFWWGFHFTGESALSIRFQILTPLIPYLIVVSSFDLMFSRRRRLVSVSILAVTFFAIGLSVTRSMILVVATVGVAVILAVVVRWFAGRLVIPRPVLRGLISGVGIVGIAMFGALIVVPDVVQRWVGRALGPHSNVTFWTRVAAVVQQWNQVANHPVAWFIGRGFGQSYHYATYFASVVIPYVPAQRFYTDLWFPAEFMWIAPIYYGGFVIGLLGIGALVGGAVIAFRAIVRLLAAQAWSEPALRPVWLGALGYLSFVGMGFASDPFILRLAAMFMGLTLGLVSARRWSRPHAFSSAAEPNLECGVEVTDSGLHSGSAVGSNEPPEQDIPRRPKGIDRRWT